METVNWIILTWCLHLWNCVSGTKVPLTETSHFCWTPFGSTMTLTPSEFDVFVFYNSTNAATCFYLSKKPFGYEHSRKDCHLLGESAGLVIRMAMVKTREKNDYITNVLMGSQSARFNNGVWLGVQWIPRDQRWTWDDGTYLGEWTNDWGYGRHPEDPTSTVCVFFKLDGSWVRGHCDIAANPVYLCEWVVDLSNATKSTYNVPFMGENSTLSRGFVYTDVESEISGVDFDSPNQDGSSSGQTGLIVGIAVCVVLGISLSAFIAFFVVAKRRKDSAKSSPPIERPPPPADVRNLTISRPIFNSSTLIRTPRDNLYELEEIPLQSPNGTDTIGYLYPVKKPDDELEGAVYEDIPGSAIYEEPTLQIRGPQCPQPMGLNRPYSDYEDIDNLKKGPNGEGRALLHFQSPPDSRPPDPPFHGDDNDLTMYKDLATRGDYVKVHKRPHIESAYLARQKRNRFVSLLVYPENIEGYKMAAMCIKNVTWDADFKP
ncbi:hypothetical protein CAPTEDRAFT_195979 [Capitella teleta]|uniref:C-type lectin domain-containing protein n=1 Tax=Capitella teleta TaxID=283909 RepID=R7TBZ5_CAPTE|nr:hypothetical protein CAPTEDRAFT_195979 [Capitella teleta]|eukprot:ELT91238.1 hypothetical protein CAPTEDRAFT_195979 [Capitella teleta]